MGVNVDAVMRTLQQRGYIEEIGKDSGPGQATLFGTTLAFLERLGLDSLDGLPPLGEFVPSADIMEQLERGLRPDPIDLGPIDLGARDVGSGGVGSGAVGSGGVGSSDVGSSDLAAESVGPVVASGDE